MAASIVVIACTPKTGLTDGTGSHEESTTMMMNKSQLISAIQHVNPTAHAAWLSHFEIGDLQDYFDHLQITLEPRGPGSAWVRRGDTRAVVWR